jgi:ABC-type transport system involved in multi-copper enzyme maturation permease subunit
VAERWRTLLAIAGTSVQETVRRRVLYVVIFLIVLLAALVASGMAVLRMAIQSGESEAAASITSGFVQMTLGLWGFATLCLSIFLGAVGISSEVSARTIVNVLARPVERSTYLAGRWLGTVAFLSLFLLGGVLLSLGVAAAFDVRYTPMLWLAFAEMFVSAVYFSGVSLSLSVVMPAVPAGATALLLSALPAMVGRFLEYPQWFIRLPAALAYYLGPSRMPVNLLEDSFGKQVLDPDYILPLEVLTENLLYTVAIFLIACAIFARRELRLR